VNADTTVNSATAVAPHRNTAHHAAPARGVGRRLARGLAAACIPVLALTGCGGDEELPKAQPAPLPSSAPAVVTDEQVDSILGAIGDQVAKADKARDKKALAQRAAGPALAQRERAYKNAKKAKKGYAMPAAVASEQILRNASSATQSWPRVTTVIASGGGQTQALVLSQESPRDDYKLWSQTTLLAGAQIPELNDARQGSALLDPNQSGLALTPKKALSDYAAMLQDGQGAKGKKAKARAAEFGSDDFTKGQVKADADQAKSLKKNNAEVEYTYKAGKTLAAQATADGSALVFGTVTKTVTTKPESKDGETGELQLSPPYDKLTGASKTEKGFEVEIASNVVMVIPKSGKATVIGADQLVSGAKLK
jgi:hypothetical protein